MRLRFFNSDFIGSRKIFSRINPPLAEVQIFFRKYWDTNVLQKTINLFGFIVYSKIYKSLECRKLTKVL